MDKECRNRFPRIESSFGKFQMTLMLKVILYWLMIFYHVAVTVYFRRCNTFVVSIRGKSFILSYTLSSCLFVFEY